MKAYLSGWESLCASSTVARFVDCNLRGIGQVMFQDNPLSGALFFAAIVWGSLAAGVPQVAICGALAVVVATLTAQWLRADTAALRAGLYGFNGFLVGLALATFIAPGPLLWTYVALGAAVSVVTMTATANALKALFPVLDEEARTRFLMELSNDPKNRLYPRRALLAVESPQHHFSC